MHALVLAVQAAQTSGDESWLQENSTVVVAVVGIVVSGLLGPMVAALLTARRERQKDHRALVVGRREDLRTLIDEAATVLAGAVAKLRPLLAAEQQGEHPPKEPAEFLGTLVPLGQRLRLRLPADHPVVGSYDAVRVKLLALSKATGTQAGFDAAVDEFEGEREKFLEAGRTALQAPVSEGKEI